jgi:hypothetical protein
MFSQGFMNAYYAGDIELNAVGVTVNVDNIFQRNTRARRATSLPKGRGLAARDGKECFLGIVPVWITSAGDVHLLLTGHRGRRP